MQSKSVFPSSGVTGDPVTFLSGRSGFCYLRVNTFLPLRCFPHPETSSPPFSPRLILRSTWYHMDSLNSSPGNPRCDRGPLRRALIIAILYADKEDVVELHAPHKDARAVCQLLIGTCHQASLAILGIYASVDSSPLQISTASAPKISRSCWTRRSFLCSLLRKT